ncbi:tyrosine-protein phosphatase [Nesterenkonia sp. PF2B19]|uniref:tyrosine-protein phosphatase n=1 Tax=Nesterenkonia sp. PF2B19 TaxID=1881858 RepID=UPI0009F72E02|nr:tyrosine-protein phosphatase [Nesterenkonia sp. PF2B19]OSM44135.1 hypothetical protein BCY76_003860 [Nesterenkonia sp. PF2B19]
MPESSPAQSGSRPRLRLSRLENLRDLGGLPVRGGRLRPARLWRADDVALASADQLAELTATGLRRIIDLRSDQELRATGPGLAADYGMRRHHLPLTQEVADPEVMAAVFEQTTSPEGAGRWYASLVDGRAADLVQAVRHVAEHPGGALVHCAAGKDRTGVVVAAVLAALGARTEDIVADYTATDARVPAVLTRLRSAGHVAAPDGRMRDVDRNHAMLRAPEATMRAMLEQLGGPEGLRDRLERAGLDAALHRRLRAHLVDPG